MKFDYVRPFLIAVLCLGINLISFGNSDSTRNDQLVKYFAEAEQGYESIRGFVEDVSIWDDGIVKEKYNELTESYNALKAIYESYISNVNSVDINSFDKEYQRFHNVYEQLIYAHDVMSTFYAKRLEWENTYFKLWEQLNHKKQQIDILYLESIKSNGASVLGHNEATTAIKKRTLYLSYKEYYKNLIFKLKLTREYRDRILVEKKILSLMDKMLELRGTNTKEVEKLLRKEKNTNSYYDIIMNATVS